MNENILFRRFLSRIKKGKWNSRKVYRIVKDLLENNIVKNTYQFANLAFFIIGLELDKSQENDLFSIMVMKIEFEQNRNLSQANTKEFIKGITLILDRINDKEILKNKLRWFVVNICKKAVSDWFSEPYRFLYFIKVVNKIFELELQEEFMEKLKEESADKAYTTKKNDAIKEQKNRVKEFAYHNYDLLRFLYFSYLSHLQEFEKENQIMERIIKLVLALTNNPKDKADEKIKEIQTYKVIYFTNLIRKLNDAFSKETTIPLLEDLLSNEQLEEMVRKRN